MNKRLKKSLIYSASISVLGTCLSMLFYFVLGIQMAAALWAQVLVHSPV